MGFIEMRIEVIGALLSKSPTLIDAYQQEAAHTKRGPSACLTLLHDAIGVASSKRGLLGNFPLDIVGRNIATT